MKRLLNGLDETYDGDFWIRNNALDWLMKNSKYVNNSLAGVVNKCNQLCFIERLVVEHWKNIVEKSFEELSDFQQRINVNSVMISKEKEQCQS